MKLLVMVSIPLAEPLFAPLDERPAVETVIRLALAADDEEDLDEEDVDELPPPKIRRGMLNDLRMLFFDWICSFSIRMVRSAYGTRPR